MYQIANMLWEPNHNMKVINTWVSYILSTFWVSNLSWIRIKLRQVHSPKTIYILLMKDVYIIDHNNLALPFPMNSICCICWSEIVYILIGNIIFKPTLFWNLRQTASHIYIILLLTNLSRIQTIFYHSWHFRCKNSASWKESSYKMYAKNKTATDKPNPKP